MGINNEKGRISYFDTAKAILILLVILGHVLIVLNPGYDRRYLTVIQAFIYSFHMPAFFIIHGILFNNEKWKKALVKEFICRRLYTMIVPYVFFEIVGMLWKAFFVKQDLRTGLYNMLTIRCNVGADWFLPALFMGSLLYLIYVKHPNRVYGIVSTVFSFVFPMFMAGNQFTIVIGRGILAYGFIMIGHAGKNFFMSGSTEKVFSMLAAVCVTGIVAIIGLKWAGNDFYGCVVGNPVTFAAGGIAGTCLILGISRYLHSNFIAYIGRHTLTIMGTHQLVIYAMTALIPNLYGGSIGKGILLLALILIFEIAAVGLIDRYLPFLVGKGDDMRKWN